MIRPGRGRLPLGAGRVDPAVTGVDGLVAGVGERQALREDADSLDHPRVGCDSGRTTEGEASPEGGAGQDTPDRQDTVRRGLELGRGLAVEEMRRRSIPAVASGHAADEQDPDDDRAPQSVQPHLPTPP